MKISIITDILILGFYRYIGYISTDILTQNISGPNIDQKSWKYKKKTLTNEIRSIINILKLFFFLRN